MYLHCEVSNWIIEKRKSFIEYSSSPFVINFPFLLFCIKKIKMFFNLFSTLHFDVQLQEKTNKQTLTKTLF